MTLDQSRADMEAGTPRTPENLTDGRLVELLEHDPEGIARVDLAVWRELARRLAAHRATVEQQAAMTVPEARRRARREAASTPGP